MSDQGEKTCPLCAEEMDLTDQQLKPCKCGYEVWDTYPLSLSQSLEGLVRLEGGLVDTCSPFLWIVPLLNFERHHYSLSFDFSRLMDYL